MGHRLSHQELTPGQGLMPLPAMDLQKMGRALLGTLPGQWDPLPSGQFHSTQHGSADLPYLTDASPPAQPLQRAPRRAPALQASHPGPATPHLTLLPPCSAY